MDAQMQIKTNQTQFDRLKLKNTQRKQETL